MQFEDQHTHDEFEIEVDEWIVSGPEDEGWQKYPVLWPGINPRPGQKWKSIYLLCLQSEIWNKDVTGDKGL